MIHHHDERRSLVLSMSMCKKAGADRDRTTYSIDDEFIKSHIKLISYSNRKYKNYHEDIIKMFMIEVAIESSDQFLSDDEDEVSFAEKTIGFSSEINCPCITDPLGLDYGLGMHITKYIMKI